jgi:hypothetical protein
MQVAIPKLDQHHRMKPVALLELRSEGKMPIVFRGGHRRLPQGMFFAIT